MLIKERLNNAINEQIGWEFFASIQYAAVASYFDQEALPLLAQHFYNQSNEERDHAMKLLHYVNETGGKLEIPAIQKPKSTFSSAAEAVDLSLQQEIKVTDQINNLMDIAKSENDHLAQQFLQWFVDEQLEEVSSMDALLKTIKRAGEGGLLFVEQYLERNKALAASNAAEGGAE